MCYSCQVNQCPIPGPYTVGRMEFNLLYFRQENIGYEAVFLGGL